MESSVETIASAKGADARRQAVKEHRSPLGEPLGTATVLRVFRRSRLAPGGAVRGLHQPVQLTGAVKALSLRHNMLWTLVGNLMYAGCQWGMLAGIAKQGKVELTGQFALALAICAPVYMLTNLQLRSAQATDTRKVYRFGDYLALRYAGTALGFLIIAAIAAIAGYSGQTLAVLLLVSLAKAFESISDVYYGFLQQQERMDLMSQSMIAKGLLSVALLTSVLALTGSLVAACAALAFAWLAVLLAYDIPRTNAVGRAAGEEWTLESQPSWLLGRLARLTWLCAPLGLSMMLASLTVNIPRYFIEHHLGAGSLGIFAAMAYVVVAGTTVINALGQAATPRLAALYATGMRSGYANLLGRLIAFAALLGGSGALIALIAGRPILTILYRPEYAERLDIFVWLMVAAGITYVSSFLGFGLTAARLFRENAIAYSLITAATGLACWMLVPRFGLLGAAWSILAAGVAACLSQTALLVLNWRKGAAR